MSLEVKGLKLREMLIFIRFKFKLCKRKSALIILSTKKTHEPLSHKLHNNTGQN